MPKPKPTPADVAEGVPGAKRVGSLETWATPAENLPTDGQDGMSLCHVCRAWRPSEHVRDVTGVRTCTTCKPDHKLDPRPLEEPKLEADRERLRTPDEPKPTRASRRK